MLLKLTYHNCHSGLTFILKYAIRATVNSGLHELTKGKKNLSHERAGDSYILRSSAFSQFPKEWAPQQIVSATGDLRAGWTGMVFWPRPGRPTYSFPN